LASAVAPGNTPGLLSRHRPVVKATDHAPAIYEFRAVAVISSELVEQETSDITVPENGECTLVVISMPDLKANYENLYKVLLANSDVDVRAP
jgi:hypothetical protein